MWDKRNACRILVGKPLAGRPLQRLIWEDNIKMNFRETGCEVDGTGSGSCPMAGFGISSVEPVGSATAVS
jgi:hypothetical protein